MSSSEEITLILANLPSDIIRKIIRVEPESIDNVKLISHRWNDLMSEHLNLPNCRPSIDYLKVASNYYATGITIALPINHYQYFGVAKWAQCRISECRVELMSRSFETWESVIPQFSAILRRSSRVAKLEFNMDTAVNDNVMCTANSAMGGIPVEELAITRLTMDQSAQTDIISFIQNNAVQRLVLSYYDCSSGIDNVTRLHTHTTCGPLFFAASRLVTQIAIEAKRINYHASPEYWKRVIAALNGTNKVTARLMYNDISYEEMNVTIILVAREE